MYSPGIQIQSPDDEEDHQPEDGDNTTIKQPSCFSYYNQTHDSVVAQNEKCPHSAAVSAPSPKLKAKKRKVAVIQLQSSGRKDRHSKVCTTRGPRDRRVRLSPTTAIQFYDVQDRLGYDRPSKAIDWLIKEAKTAIDALSEQQPNAAQNHGGFLISECGMIETHGHLNDDSGFSFCVGGAAPSRFQAYLNQDFNTSRNGSEASEDVVLYPSHDQCSALTATSQMLELQKMSTWNENSSGGGGGREECSCVDSPTQPISGQREPLQSSFINYYSPINTDFPGFNFCDELSDITASATLKEDDKDNKPGFSSLAPFLH